MRVCTWMLMMGAVVACDETDADSADPGDIVATVVTEMGTCFPEDVLAAAPTLSFEQVTFQTGAIVPVGVDGVVVDSDEDLVAFEMLMGASITQSIDFDTHVLLFAVVDSGSTCGMPPAVEHVVSVDGSPHLSVEFTNPEATCGGAICDMVETAYRMVIVERNPEQAATACGRLIETCE